MKRGNLKISSFIFFSGTLFLLIIVMATFSFPAEIQSEEFVNIAIRNNVQQKLIIIKPKSPVASVILFSGGNGILGLGSASGKPTIKNDRNFLIRARRDFAKHGLMATVIDAPSDKGMGIDWRWRIGQKHAGDIRAVVSYLKKQEDIPIWLVGTSMGTISASNGAITCNDIIKGVILTSSMTRSKRNKSHPNGIISMELDKIRVPVQIISHKDDKCKHTPAKDAEKIKAALVNSPKVTVLYFKGGKLAESHPCDALSQHGFYGIEDQVVTAIAEFIKAN